MPEEPTKSVIVESTTTVRKQEGETAILSFAGSKHATKWIITAVGLLVANLGHNVVEDFLPPKGEAGREETRQTSARAVYRNDEDNKSIKEKLDAILVMKNDLDSVKSDMRDLKNNVDSFKSDMTHRMDEVILNVKK